MDQSLIVSKKRVKKFSSFVQVVFELLLQLRLSGHVTMKFENEFNNRSSKFRMRIIFKLTGQMTSSLVSRDEINSEIDTWNQNLVMLLEL